MNYRSHTIEEIEQALESGQEVWELDTGLSGEDDMLIGTYEDALWDILHHFDVEMLPENWELTKICITPWDL